MSETVDITESEIMLFAEFIEPEIWCNPMYAMDKADMLIASGGTAGYCAVAKKADSCYDLEYIQAWLANSYTEKIFNIVGSDFEGGFISRGTFVNSYKSASGLWLYSVEYGILP